MTTDLTKINGIGTNSAKALREAGFESIEAIAKASPEALDKISGFGPKRAERVIASAKQLVQDAKPIPVVAPAVAATRTSRPAAHTSRPAKRGRSRTFFATAAVLLLLVAAFLYFGYQNGAVDFAPFQTAKQDSTDVAPQQGAMRPGQNAMNVPGNPGNTAMAGHRTTLPGQQTANGARNADFAPMSAMPRQANEPQWVARQRAQADMHRAQAEKMRVESWNRFVASLPPAQAEQVVRQHKMAMAQIEESQRRQAAMIEQHNAYINQRFGG